MKLIAIILNEMSATERQILLRVSIIMRFIVEQWFPRAEEVRKWGVTRSQV